jgi:uncharacterized RDD family membrane protein YckC
MSDSTPEFPPATLAKRLLAIVYDLLLLTALLFAVGVVVAGVLTFAVNNGNAITEEHPFYYTSQLIILSVMLCASYLFFGWFWVHGGQTLGMKTWCIKLTTIDNKNISWKQATIRFFVAIFSWLIVGQGFIRSLFDKEKRTRHDIQSGTKLIQLDKRKS